jgi:hypothetical protein
MTNERTLEEAIALIRVLVAHSHEPLPRDLLEEASKFLEGFPYEPREPHIRGWDLLSDGRLVFTVDSFTNVPVSSEFQQSLMTGLRQAP